MVKEASSLPGLQVEGIAFSPVVTPPGSSKALFLAGAGNRGLEINGQFVVFTAIGVYLEDEAVPTLAARWRGKTAEELAGDSEFFRDVFAGSFEKHSRITMVKPLTGQMYSEKVAENCVAQWKAAGVYTDAEGTALEKFKAAFAAETFPPGSSILFTHHPSPGSLTIAFSKEDGSTVPATASALVEDKALSEAVLESIIGEHGVSPAAKRSLARRVSELLSEPAEAEAEAQAQEKGAKAAANPLSVSV